MNNFNDIGDEQFTPFLHSLGVETYNKSFEWMLCDPDFGDVLRWFYSNLDQNNALTAREECRYLEIDNRGNLQSSEDLKAALFSIEQEYDGICLPGDREAVDDVELDIKMQRERLVVLEKHEADLNELIRQNEIIKQELEVEVIKLNAVQRQCEEDENVAAQECLKLAEQVDSITNDVMSTVADTLKVYSTCLKDKESAKRFLTFGPLDTYRQSQAMFRSHFDLFTAKKFDKRNDDETDDELRRAVIEAKNMEGRLYDALFAYIESKVELSGEQAKLALVSNYSNHNVHPNQIISCIMEAQSALELLKQEESILDQELKEAAKDLVNERTSLAIDTATRSALDIREQIYKDLSFLLEVTQEAYAVDRLLYSSLRHELRSVEDLLHFASQLRLYVLEDRDAVASRLQSMNNISDEHNTAEQSLDEKDLLLNTLRLILKVEGPEASALVKSYTDLTKNVQELKDSVQEGFRNKEASWHAYKNSTKQLTNYVYDGCTRQPNCCNRSLTFMTHTLRSEIDRVDRVVLDASGLFQTVKSSDKSSLRKLWQWFLTDPTRLFAAIKNVQTRKYT